MKVTVTKKLDIEALYDEMLDDFCYYSAIEEIGLTREDLKPALMAKIFAAIVEEIEKRAEK